MKLFSSIVEEATVIAIQPKTLRVQSRLFSSALRNQIRQSIPRCGGTSSC